MRKTQGIRARKEGKGWGGLHAGRNEDARGGGGSTGGAGRSSGPRPASHRTCLRGQPPRVRALALAALAGVLTLAALATPAHAQTGITPGWSLKPAGLTVGTKFRLLFLSSTRRGGDDSNIAVYNTFIQARAKVGHTDIRDYSAGFRVVGCTSNTDARDNTATTYTQADKGVRIYWLGGAKVADNISNYEDFYDGSWDEERHDKNERGTNGPDTSQNSNLPYTGCAHDGTEDTFGGNSRALGPHRTRVGRPNTSGSHNGPLSSGVDGIVGQIRPMYGLSEVFEVKAKAPTASNATVTTNEDVEYGFRAADFNFVGIASNDSLARVKITTLPTNGALELNGTALTSSDLPQTVTVTKLHNYDLRYVPPENANGTGYTSFMFKVDDGNADSADSSAYTMTVNVVAVNDAPASAPATVRTAERTAYTFRASDFNFMDTESADTLSSIKITTLPVTGFGTLSFDGAVLGSSDLPKTVTSTELGANKLVFTPESCQDYATFMFKVNDGRADSASAYTMTVDVVPAPNNAPVLAEPIPNQYARVGEAFMYTVAQGAFSDPDECDVLAYRALWDRYPETPHGGTLPAWLHFDRMTGTFSGTPVASDVDSLSVKVEASDGAAAVRDVFYLEVQPAARATAPLVSNLDQGWRLGSRTRRAALRQRFTTGPNAGGYTLGSIDVGRHEGVATDIWTDDAKVRLSVCPVAPATGSCTALTPPSRTTRWADTMRFTVQGTMMLAPSTTYDLAVSGASGHWPWIGATQVGSLDADSLPGWRLASRSNRTTVRVALHGSANNPAAMPNSADADIVVTQGSSYTFAASDFPFTASSGGGAFWGVEVTSVPEKERSSTTRFKRGRLTFGGGDFYAPFTVTKAALDAGRLVYSAPADDAVGEDYDWFRFRVRDAGHASMASYRMRIDVVASSQQQGAEPAVIDGTPQVSGAGTDAQWSEGETVGVTVTFSEAVDVDTTGGTPSIGIGLGGTAARSATYASGTGTTELVFEYTLASGDGAHGSMAVTPDSLARNGGTIRSADERGRCAARAQRRVDVGRFGAQHRAGGEVRGRSAEP